MASAAAASFKKVSLELGGKNPNIVFADCDFEKAAMTTMRSSFANQGQICLCGSRVLVQHDIFERFRDAVVESAQQMTVGDPLEPNTKVGAVVSKTHLAKIAKLCLRCKGSWWPDTVRRRPGGGYRSMCRRVFLPADGDRRFGQCLPDKSGRDFRTGHLPNPVCG